MLLSSQPLAAWMAPDGIEVPTVWAVWIACSAAVPHRNLLGTDRALVPPIRADRPGPVK